MPCQTIKRMKFWQTDLEDFETTLERQPVNIQIRLPSCLEHQCPDHKVG